MATSKRTRSRKRRKPDPFAVVRGKVVERIEVSTMDDDCAIGILFKDRTYLGFDLEPFLRITPDFPTGKLTTTNRSNAGHLSTPNNPLYITNTEPAERRVLLFGKLGTSHTRLCQNVCLCNRSKKVVISPIFSMHYSGLCAPLLAAFSSGWRSIHCSKHRQDLPAIKEAA